MKRALLFTLNCYRLFVSPLLVGLGGKCRFQPSCSEYAMQVIEVEKTVKAIGLIMKRLVKCGPWHPGGTDAVQGAGIWEG